MNRLAKKFIVVLALVIISVNILCIMVNSMFVERYYLKMSQLALEKVYQEADIEALATDYKMQQKLEKEEGIVTVYMAHKEDIEALNTQLISAFQDKGLKLSKFWIGETDYTKLLETGAINKLYNQTKLDYSVLVKFIDYQGGILACAKIIPHLTETIKLINQFTTLIFIIGMLSMVVLVSLLVKRMTKPLSELSRLARRIAKLDFQKVEIHTKDEIEDLANHINQMSESLKTAHHQLEKQNQQMKTLLSNIAHELKTPIALIKAYTQGIKDEIDDGTFLEVIMMQNETMETKIESLLQLAKMEQEVLQVTQVNISQLVSEVILAQSIQIEKHQLDFKSDLEKECYAYVSKDEMASVFTNLLTNAIKYSADQKINMHLKKEEDHLVFEIANGIEGPLELEEIWKPFYVGEASRSKALSGTGLGLSIVKIILDKHEIDYSCIVKHSQFKFRMILPTYAPINLLLSQEKNIIE